MARDRGRRYASARDLAEDCRRFLEGEEIRARRAGWSELPVRWARRRKALVAVGATALAALLAAAALGRQAHRLRATVEAALRKEAGIYIDATLTLRRAGLPMRKAQEVCLPKPIAAVEEAEREVPDSSEPHHQLGRMYRALLRPDEALAAQERALAIDPDHAPGLYGRVLLTAGAYIERRHQSSGDMILNSSPVGTKVIYTRAEDGTVYKTPLPR